MIDSVEFYNAAFCLPQKNLSYLQIVTAIFYELTTKKNSPLISEMCATNGIDFDAQNFQVEKISVSRLPYAVNSFDMYIILVGLNEAFSKNLDACAMVYESFKNYVFAGNPLNPKFFPQLINLLENIDEHLKKSSPQISNDENLLQELNCIAKDRTEDDEKIIAEIIKVQADVQNSLKAISEIRDGLDFRTLQEPIKQLIYLYNKLDDNLKLHPQSDAAKGYERLLKRCQSFLKYIAQSLKMLGVELINETGGTFDPDKNKVIDDENFSLDSTVTKVNKIGFIYKGKVIEKSLVEVARNF